MPHAQNHTNRDQIQRQSNNCCNAPFLNFYCVFIILRKNGLENNCRITNLLPHVRLYKNAKYEHTKKSIKSNNLSIHLRACMIFFKHYLHVILYTTSGSYSSPSFSTLHVHLQHNRNIDTIPLTWA